MDDFSSCTSFCLLVLACSCPLHVQYLNIKPVNKPFVFAPLRLTWLKSLFGDHVLPFVFPSLALLLPILSYYFSGFRNPCALNVGLHDLSFSVSEIFSNYGGLLSIASGDCCFIYKPYFVSFTFLNAF